MTCELPCVDFLLRDRVQDPPKRKEVVGRWVVFVPRARELPVVIVLQTIPLFWTP